MISRWGEHWLRDFTRPSGVYRQGCTALLVAPTAKTDVERSTAVITTRSTFYNQRVAKSYETVASPLTSDEADWIDQLFTSREVMRFEPNPCDDTEPRLLAPVLITDTVISLRYSFYGGWRNIKLLNSGEVFLIIYRK